jgi:hypothetical protein
MITLIMPPKTQVRARGAHRATGPPGKGSDKVRSALVGRAQISFSQKLLTDEYGTASNIKSRVNR